MTAQSPAERPARSDGSARPRARPAGVVRPRARLRRGADRAGSSPPSGRDRRWCSRRSTASRWRTSRSRAPPTSPRPYARARRAQESWARTPLAERAEVLLRLHDLVLDRQDEILDLIVLGVRQGPQARLRRAGAHRADRPLLRAAPPTQHLDTRRLLGLVPGLTRVEVNRVPKGVVGIISPWNYPFTMALCDGLPALLAGNAVVAKPDAQTHADRAARRRSCSRRPGCPPTCGRSWPGPGPSSARRSSTAPTTSASPARPPPAGSSRSSAPSG